MKIKIINESSKGLPQELLSAISNFKDFDEINDIVEAWNLKVKSIDFIYTEDEKLKEQKIIIGNNFSEN